MAFSVNAAGPRSRSEGNAALTIASVSIASDMSASGKVAGCLVTETGMVGNLIPIEPMMASEDIFAECEVDCNTRFQLRAHSGILMLKLHGALGRRNRTRGNCQYLRP
jgi:hypothetical protein